MFGKHLQRIIALLLLPLVFACGKNDEDVDLTVPPGIICPQGSAQTAMKGEKIIVNAVGIAETTVVTVKFGKETTLTRTGPGIVSYAFTKSGNKTITVTMSPAEVPETSFKLHVEKLESLQMLASRLKMDPNLCLVMAHRGNSSDWSIPENSLGAINKCVIDKVDIFETDVYTTKDGVLVISHDADLSRETNGSGNISGKTLAQIKELYLKDRNGNVTTEKMLTLDEFLEPCKGQIYVNIDIGDRNASVQQVVEEVAKKGMTQQVLVYCNNADRINTAFKTNPDCNVYTYVSQVSHLINAATAGNLYFTQCGWNPTTAAASRTGKVDSSKQPTSASQVATAVNAGTILTVNAIYTLNTAQLYPKSFPVAQLEDIFTVFPACQCVHVDTGAEARASLITYGKNVIE